MTGEKVTPPRGVEIIRCRVNGPRGVVKAFVLYDERDTVLVDAGFDDTDADRIIDGIRRIGREADDLTACAITHAHGDHIGALSKLRSMSRFPVIAHEREAALIEQRTGQPVDQAIEGDTQLALLDGVQVIEMPGHSVGSIAILWPSMHTLLPGDAIMSAGEHLMVPPPFLCVDPDQARASVERLLAMNLPIDAVLVAHGEEVRSGAAVPLGRLLAEKRNF